jgi:hypothetical protein
MLNKIKLDNKQTPKGPTVGGTLHTIVKRATWQSPPPKRKELSLPWTLVNMIKLKKNMLPFMSVQTKASMNITFILFLFNLIKHINWTRNMNKARVERVEYAKKKFVHMRCMHQVNSNFPWPISLTDLPKKYDLNFSNRNWRSKVFFDKPNHIDVSS